MNIHLPLFFRTSIVESHTRPTAIDLFCGCGGVTQGLKEAGFNVLGAIDSSEIAVKTYTRNHPEVTVWEGDITELPVANLMHSLGLQRGELDLLAGCPPCQGYSSMRTLNGSRQVRDERNDLVFEFMRFVDAFKPKVVMMENVPELANDSRIDEVYSTLERLGYFADRDKTLRVLDAADYGVAQRRRRMILLTGSYTQIRFPTPDTQRLHIRDVIENLPPAGESGNSLHDYPERRSQRIMDLISRIPHDGGSRTDLPEEDQLDCHKRCNGFKDVYGRMTWDEVSPTITSGCTNPSKGRFLHPVEDRAITLWEAALLQSFPANYFFSLDRGKTGAAWLIGNALPPRLIRELAFEITIYLSVNSQ